MRMCDKKLCMVCGEKPIDCSGRCATCRMYFKKYGVERPASLIEKARALRMFKQNSARWCRNCGSLELGYNMRCFLCANYLARHGKERPRVLWSDDPRCKNCKKPLPTDGRRYHSGKCELCRHYEEEVGRNRPPHLWGDGKFGFCECGYPADHLIDKFPLCNRCAKEYQQPIVAVAGDAHGGRRGSVRW